MIIRFLLHIIANALAVLTAEWLVPGVIYNYEFLSLIKIALILALINALLKPMLKLVFSPLILITLGFFTIIINIFLIWLAVYFVPELSIAGFTAYFWTMIIVSIFNFIVSAASHKKPNVWIFANNSNSNCCAFNRRHSASEARQRSFFGFWRWINFLPHAPRHRKIYLLGRHCFGDIIYCRQRRLFLHLMRKRK